MITFYICNPELFKSCKKGLCGTECTLTTLEQYAQRDEFGRPIVAYTDDLSRPEESEIKEES